MMKGREMITESSMFSHSKVRLSQIDRKNHPSFNSDFLGCQPRDQKFEENDGFKSRVQCIVCTFPPSRDKTSVLLISFLICYISNEELLSLFFACQFTFVTHFYDDTIIFFLLSPQVSVTPSPSSKNPGFSPVLSLMERTSLHLIVVKKEVRRKLKITDEKREQSGSAHFIQNSERASPSPEFFLISE